MRTKFLALLEEKKELNFTDVIHLIPEAKGEYNMYMPTKKGLNKNVLWLAEVTEEFIHLFNDLLITEKLITWDISDVIIFMIDGSPVYNHVPLCNMELMKGKKECWLPIVIKLA